LLDTRPVRSGLVYSESVVEDQLQLAIKSWCSKSLTLQCFQMDTWFEMQTGVKKIRASKHSAKHNPKATNLMELKPGESGILDRLDLPEDDARRLMELGFLPGHAVTPGHSAPGGDPRVFRVDGSEVALRRETARKLILRHDGSKPNAAKES
jgi:ferrous iron transport protein A